MNTTRVKLPDDFFLRICFDGKTFVAANDSELVMRLVTDPHLTGIISPGPGADPVGSLSSLMPAERNVIPPKYVLKFSVGSNQQRFTLDGAGEEINKMWVWARAGYDLTSIKLSLAQELVTVTNNLDTCLRNSSWIGDIGCRSGWAGNVSFAFARAHVANAKGSLGMILTLVDSAAWADLASSQANLLKNSTKSFTIPALPSARSGSANGSGGLAGSIGSPRVSDGGSDGGNAAQPPVTLSIQGFCSTDGGALTGESTNFTPGGTARIRAWYPNGDSYTNLLSTSRVNGSGHISWTWPCEGDPAGTYTTEVVDNATGRSTGRVRFTIGAGAPPQPKTWTEQSGSHGSPTFQNPSNASGQGPTIPAMSNVEVSCKIKPSSTIDSAKPDGYWYRIASAPWNNQYYAVANTFWNGDIPGVRPYTHNTDWTVSDC